ncbi:MAG: PASTA domain-containing protein [Prevotellaceae bacterium]|jgi:cell division protein FtsI (penicillin-binding protein 3)|nr:PASTA domain-containing protein [Prevotellaceae bacterium]
MSIKSRIYTGFHLIYIALAFAFVLCIYNIVKIQYIEHKTWEDISKFIKDQQPKKKPDEAKRGQIKCIDGNILASSLLVYKISFNGGQLVNIENELKKKEQQFNRSDSVRILAKNLSKFFGDASVTYYESRINDAYSGRKTIPISLSNRSVNYVEWQKLMTFPLLNGAKGKYMSCLETVRQNNRVQPFGNLAFMTIGDVYPDKSKTKIGKFGIEGLCDSLLKGKDGENGQKAINGSNITLTLNMDMQDIVANSLLKQMQKLGVERGCAILMEVETGEIKAMANLAMNGRGGYSEIEHMAILNRNPPGSTFKTVSMLVALENGIVTPNTIVNALETKYKDVHDHGTPPASWKTMKASDVLVYSSNVGTANIIGGAYQANPMDFMEAVKKTKINEPFDTLYLGSGRSNIDMLKINGTYLPSTSFGYQVVVPPIYMLRFYNAIANGGKMINPFIIKEIETEGSIKKNSTQTVNPSICSKKTLEELQNMLRQVVEKEGGTGYSHRSKNISFAGKTGTANFKTKDGKTNVVTKTDQVSFCGYFPADSIGKPQYSCIVVMQRQDIWGSQCCEVFRDIAEKISALDSHANFADVKADTTVNIIPLVKNGLRKNITYLLDKLEIKSKIDNTKWTVLARNATQITGTELPLVQNLVPNVVGMGAKDAVYLMEQAGLHVNLAGRGKVTSQTLAPGTRIVKGVTVGLVLY